MLQSIEAKMFVDIQTYLAAEMPEIKWIDHDFNQQQLNPRPAIDLPAILIDFEEINFEDQQFSQYGNPRIKFTLLTGRWDNTNHVTPAGRKEAALLFYELCHKLHTKLQGWKAMGSVTLNLPFKRVRTASNKLQLEGMYGRELFYECQFEDESVGGL